MKSVSFWVASTVSILAIATCTAESTPPPTSNRTQTQGSIPTSVLTPTESVTSVASETPVLPATTIPTRVSNVDISYDRRTPFVPLDNPALLPGEEAEYLQDDDLVLGIEWENVTHAYPVRMLRFHHIVNDTIAGRPFLITY